MVLMKCNIQNFTLPSQPRAGTSTRLNLIEPTKCPGYIVTKIEKCHCDKTSLVLDIVL